ncbi:hypothetical protein [Magnetospirillum gryphiswaldense]|uniref:Uncharacterized protein n=1 Tax=Magnetospirillum gryphiswaldense TaxID=55518 RepID=A4U156_9PROT|nr:hypothetical protein [Magnetospirillum gryphiswaldense]AVM75606.1 hypothetical protein MSR1_31400 [Magnetospirillum gryphiswaldense MSR-1]AVM79509.1 hypothetical protein MSR1L_31400 [Magnetospirillum gryphiswaldense]CAM76613.1 hypothetical protein MGR_1143 [Magnetospirillum gryphiswaldense MSR-1]
MTVLRRLWPWVWIAACLIGYLFQYRPLVAGIVGKVLGGGP